MGKAVINIELETKEYQQLAERLREHNYLFNTDLDLKAYVEFLLKTEISMSKQTTTLE